MPSTNVTCPDCHTNFKLPAAVQENIRAGVDRLRPENNVRTLRRKTKADEVPVTIWLDIDELGELVGQANEVGVGVDEYIVGHLQDLT